MTGSPHPPKPDEEPSGVAGAVPGYLIAGIGVWGFLGWLADRWLDLPSNIGIMIGMMVGAAGAIYLIMKRLSA